MMFPGEEDAIRKVCELGEKYGYGNLIHRLKIAWSKELQVKGIDPLGADIAAGLICVWCHVDSRDGKRKKFEGKEAPKYVKANYSNSKTKQKSNT